MKRTRHRFGWVVWIPLGALVLSIVAGKIDYMLATAGSPPLFAIFGESVVAEGTRDWRGWGYRIRQPVAPGMPSLLFQLPLMDYLNEPGER